MESTDQASGERGQAELNCHMQEESKGIRDGGACEGLSEEDESRVGEDANGGLVGGGPSLPVNHGAVKREPPTPPPPTPAVLQQQPPGSVVRWERFLPLRSLKVLLVENDDSTRQVVSALLHNCSYEVTATASGFEAWKILEDLTNHVDIVLTEVVMPGLSGIGLLCKIMSHKTCKNIPVIMMSSHDSMGIVFKCLSKGAVDFLVKPIRKNELKNLWQHIWRRCQSSSGSGSESGIQSQISVKSKSVESDNNTRSNSEDDDKSIGLNARDGSDNGSGTQSSWTKRAAEIESPQPMSPSDQLADQHDSTCAQVILPKTETFCNEWVPMAGSRNCQEKEIHDNESMGKDLEIGVPRDSDKQLKYPSEKAPLNMTGTSIDKFIQNDSRKNNPQSNEELPECKATREPSTQVADLIGVIANINNSQILTRMTEASNDPPKISEYKDKAIDVAEELPSLELSLKRLTSTKDGGNATNDDRNILRHSDMSAFSRYNTSATSNQVPTGGGGSYSFQLDNSSEVVNKKSLCNPLSIPKSVPLNPGSNDSSNNDDVGSTTKNAFTKPANFTEMSASTSVAKGVHNSAFHPIQQRTSANQDVLNEKVNDLAANSALVQPRGIHHQVQVQHHHHHYHHHHVHGMQQQKHQMQHPPDQDEFSLKIMASAAPQCGSSNVLSGPVECNAANYSVNDGYSGSNHVSNAQNGSIAAANTGGVNIESDSGGPGKSGGGSGNGSGSGSGSGVDQNRFAQREAALNKFRQKRKERCFEKKVRYQSRKRLAEQRPRVRGQFVRQAVREQDRDADC